MKYLIISLLLFSSIASAKPWAVSEAKGTALTNPELMRWSVKFDDVYLALTREPTITPTKVDLATDVDHPILSDIVVSKQPQPTKRQMLSVLTRFKNILQSSDPAKTLRLMNKLIADREQALNELALVRYVVKAQ